MNLTVKADADSPLYVSDLDGTLLRNDTSLSQCSKDTLNALLDQGLLFTVASARSIASMCHLLADLPLRLPVIEFNGAFVSDLASGQHYLVHDLHRDILSELWQQITDTGYIPFISTYDGTADRLYYCDITNDGMAWYLRNRQLHQDPRLRYVADLQSGLDDQVVCLTVIGPGPELEKLDEAINQRHAKRVQTHCYENQYSPLALADHPRCLCHQRAGHTESQALARTGRLSSSRLWRPSKRLGYVQGS